MASSSYKPFTGHVTGIGNTSSGSMYRSGLGGTATTAAAFGTGGAGGGSRAPPFSASALGTSFASQYTSAGASGIGSVAGSARGNNTVVMTALSTLRARVKNLEAEKAQFSAECARLQRELADVRQGVALSYQAQRSDGQWSLPSCTDASAPLVAGW